MISIKSPDDLKLMREGGRILATILYQVSKEVRSGVATKDLDRLAESLIFELGGSPSFKGYNRFPAAMCVSVNEEIVHGIPSDRALAEGEVVTLDLGILYKGFHSDMALTVGVGNIEPEIQRLIRVTRKALKRGIKKARVGNTFGDIGNTIERYVEGQGFGVVRELCGHGIGKRLHEDPQILNFGKRHSGPAIKAGMTFCIEPMVTIGDWHAKIAKDGVSYATKDKSWAAHFEHTVAVLPEGPEILTRLESEPEDHEFDNEEQEET
jgi:methionyl aminopeptidase